VMARSVSMGNGIREVTYENGEVRYRVIMVVGKHLNGPSPSGKQRWVQKCFTFRTLAEAEEARAGIVASRGTLRPEDRSAFLGLRALSPETDDRACEESALPKRQAVVGTPGVCVKCGGPAPVKRKWCPTCEGPTKADYLRLCTYGVSYPEWIAVLAVYSGKCWICQAVTRRSLINCHTTNKVRGALCPGCNSALHALEKPHEWQIRARRYLAS
jgi:hypothetical protein